MEREQRPGIGTQAASCPCLQPAQADWLYPVAGYCRALPDGLLMIPTVEEYRTLCSSGHHATCLLYRYRQGDEGVESLLRAHCQTMGRFSPLDGLFGRTRGSPAGASEDLA